MAEATTTPSPSPAGAFLAPATGASPRTPSVMNATPRASTPSISAAAAAASPRNGAPNGPTATIENVMDELMLQYLKARGYQIVAPASAAGTPLAASTPLSSLATPVTTIRDGDVMMASPPPLSLNGTHDYRDTNGAPAAIGPTTVPVASVTEDERRKFLGVGRIEKSVRRGSGSSAAGEADAAASLARYAQQMGLSTESCAANHMLFYGLTGGDPSAFTDAYAKLTEWVCNSLDMYKYELHAVTFPVFVHCYLDLLAKGYAEAAKAFFVQFASDHMRLHVEELRQLSLIFTPDHVRASEYAQQVLHSKFNIHVSLLSFELLNAFLSQEKLFLVLSIVNERINLVVTTNQPGMLIEQLEDVPSTNGMPSMALRSDPNGGYRSSDDVARVVASSEEPNESEIGVPLTTGEYNLEYMVHIAGGEGKTLEDLHAIKVNWGVLPARKLPQEQDADGGPGDANGSKADEEGGTNGGGPGGSGDGSSGADQGKKSTANGSSENGPADGSASVANKSGDKAGTKAGVSGDKGGPVGASEAQRKGKRARSGGDADSDRRKSELDVVGPLPDRKNAFNAQLLERLVLRQPAEMKNQALEDLKVRASLSKSNLPSALCFSFANAGGAHVNNMCFSEDVTMVGASCDDGSFRVWRNDDQPLGTARGAVYHGDLTETDEDEKTAVLRGHSSAVYGAAFSPDNRFGLTASGDSTVRLWSLAAKSNVAIYRSHEGFPVWDVRFGRYGYYFASCSMDRTARLWSTDRMTPLRVFAGHLSDVDCVEFHPNHNYIATGSSDKTVRLWDIQTGKCIRIFTGHFHGVSSLAFSSNGRYLASSGEDQYINIWDLQAGKRLETLVGHRSTVTSLSFSQESAILASSGMDSTVRLWDMQSVVDKPMHSVVAPPPSHSTQTTATPLHASNASSSYVRPVRMVRPSSAQDLPSSRFLLKTLRSKQTPIYRVQFTPRNLLLSGGVFLPKTEA